MTTAEHPILVTEILRADGARHLRLRVFCARRAESVSVDICRTCSACVEISGDPSGATSWIECEGGSTDESLGGGVIESQIGSILSGHTLCVQSNVPVSELPAVFLRSDLSVLFVVDSRDALIGAVTEMNLLRASGSEIFHRAGLHERADDLSGPTLTALEIMSAAHPVRDDDSLRRALLEMAHTRSRQIAVVGRDGSVVGTIRDLEAIAAFGARNRTR